MSIFQISLLTRQQLASSNVIGFAYTALAITLTVAAAILAIQSIGFAWLLGQVLFALAFLEWFLIIHTAGHLTLFRHRLPNQLVGTIAGFFVLIPCSSWHYIHARGHVWTSWQDMDAMTATLVPRKLANWQKYAINFAWRSGLPLFSILYRLQNNWNVNRLRQFLPATVLPRIRNECLVLLAAYAALALRVGLYQLAANGGCRSTAGAGDDGPFAAQPAYPHAASSV